MEMVMLLYFTIILSSYITVQQITEAWRERKNQFNAIESCRRCRCRRSKEHKKGSHNNCDALLSIQLYMLLPSYSFLLFPASACHHFFSKRKKVFHIIGSEKAKVADIFKGVIFQCIILKKFRYKVHFDWVGKLFEILTQKTPRGFGFFGFSSCQSLSLQA